MSYTEERFVLPTRDVLTIEPITNEFGKSFLYVRYWDRINTDKYDLPTLETHLCTSINFNESGAAVCITTIWDNDEDNIVHEPTTDPQEFHEREDYI